MGDVIKFPSAQPIQGGTLAISVSDQGVLFEVEGHDAAVDLLVDFAEVPRLIEYLRKVQAWQRHQSELDDDA